MHSSQGKWAIDREIFSKNSPPYLRRATGMVYGFPTSCDSQFLVADSIAFVSTTATMKEIAKDLNESCLHMPCALQILQNWFRFYPLLVSEIVRADC